MPSDQYPDLFHRLVDGERVDFVRPADTTADVWVAYARSRPLGTLALESGGTDGPAWRLQSTHQRHRELDDAVRALGLPTT